MWLHSSCRRDPLSWPLFFNEYSDEKLSFTEMSPSIFCPVYNRFMRLVLAKAPQSFLTAEKVEKTSLEFHISIPLVGFCGPFSQLCLEFYAAFMPYRNHCNFDNT